MTWSNHTVHAKSVRKASFCGNGREVVSVSVDKRICLTDVENNSVKWHGKGHKDAINALCIVDNHTFATGADDGEIRIWDSRAEKSTCRSKVSEFESTIAEIAVGKSTKELLATCEDQLGCFDLRNGKVSLQGMSDNVEDELQCFVCIKTMKKVVCGSNTGQLCLFSYGHWGDINDRVNVHQKSIESIVPYDDDTVLIGGDDGNIHVVSILPNEVKGQLKLASNFKMNIYETGCLCISPSKTYLAFVADFEHICITPTSEIVSILQGEQEDNFFGDL